MKNFLKNILEKIWEKLHQRPNLNNSLVAKAPGGYYAPGMGTYVTDKIQKVIDSCKCSEQLLFCEKMVDNLLNTIENSDDKKELRAKYNILLKNKRTKLYL